MKLPTAQRGEPIPNAKTTSVCAGQAYVEPPAGIEPATPSLPWNHQEPLCEPPSPQVTPDRQGQSYRFSLGEGMRSLPVTAVCDTGEPSPTSVTKLSQLSILVRSGSGPPAKAGQGVDCRSLMTRQRTPVQVTAEAVKTGNAV